MRHSVATAGVVTTGRPLRSWDGAALLPCVALWLAFVRSASWSSGGGRCFTLFDDAMISMAFGRTLADGHGLVWYPGAERVEGFSNPLWTLFMAGVHWVGLGSNGASLAIILTGMLLLAGSALLAAAIVRNLAVEMRWAPPVAALVVGLCYPLVYWTLVGMEVGLITFLTLAACLLALRIRARASSRALAGLALVLTLGISTRLDFLVIAVTILAWLLVELPASRRWRETAVLVGIVGSALVAQFVLRSWYYGRLVPNTYTLKVAGIALGTRLSRGARVTVVGMLVGFLAPALVVTVAAVRHQRARAEFTLFGLLAASVAAYGIFVGGDAWETLTIANRYLTPGLVVLLIGAVAGIELLVGDFRDRPRLLGILTILVGACALVGPLVAVLAARVLDVYDWGLLSTGTVPVLVVLAAVSACSALLLFGCNATLTWQVSVIGLLAVAMVTGIGARPFYALQSNGVGAPQAVRLGYELADITNRHARIAVLRAGAPIYYSNRPGVDLLGKMDPIVARAAPRWPFLPGHNKMDLEHSIGELRPDLIAECYIDGPYKNWGYVLVRPLDGWAEVLEHPCGGPGEFWALDGSPNVRWDRLSRR